MANYDSTLYTAQAAGLAQTPTPAHAGGAMVAYASVAVDTSLAANDLLRFFYLPKNAKVVHAVLKSSDIDSNASPAVLFDVGDSGDTDRLFANSTVGQAGTADNNAATTGLGYTYTDETLIYATVDTAGATKVAGTVYLTVWYTLEA